MKNELIVAPLLALFLVTGCQMINPETGEKEFDASKTAKVKAAVALPLTSGVGRVLLNSPEHSEDIARYLGDMRDIFCQLSETGEFDPVALAASINGIPKLQVADPSLNDLKNLVITLFTLHSSGYSKELDNEKAAYHVADVICTSLSVGLSDAGFGADE